MKKTFHTCLVFLAFLIGAPDVQGQWGGSTTLTDDTYRYGSVGIGTITPMAKLHLYKGKGEVLTRLHKYSSFTLEHHIWDLDIEKNGKFYIGFTQNPEGVTTNRMTIDTKGNVGIGTSAPDQLFTLYDANEPVMRFERAGSNWDYEIYATSGGQLRFRGGTNGTGDQLTDHMVMNGQGKLMIGTENAPSQLGTINIDQFRLFVAGGVLTEEVIVRTDWADYVFEEDYELTPLQEVETHIQEKGYLHHTPSAAVIESGGLHLGEITVNQQEKIEELFLHLIEMEKEVKQLQEKVRLLESNPSIDRQ